MRSCELLHAEIRQLFYADLDVLADDEEGTPSLNDLRCTEKYNQSVKRVNGRYYCDLPLKNDDVKLPNNESQAISILEHQLKLVKRDVEAKEFYMDTIKKLIETEKVEAVDLKVEPECGRTNYVPHFFTKQKKRRLVNDAFAEFKGVSLNSVLLQGENCVPNLWCILMRFRRFSIAFSCDIEEMFMQCGVNERDRDLLRILWIKNDDLDGQVQAYRFKRLPNGLNWSMSMANFCLKKTAEENLVGVSDETVKLVYNSFYVDDGLVSCSSVNDGRTANELMSLLQSGGFELRKFTSNNPEILQDLEPSRLLPKGIKNFDLELSCTVLGLHWNADSDTISPKVKLKNRPATKRGLWATVPQIFDPLGICAPNLPTGRKILHEASERTTEWDEPLPSDLERRWNKHMKSLPNLKRLVIERCYWKEKVERYELHTFCDSSENGYGCVSYLRMINQDDCKVAFVVGKPKVIPKSSTYRVPRLKLVAAMLGVKVHDQVKKEIELPLTKCCLYTDSTIVLDWLHAADKRLKKFVARKVAEIKRLCGGHEWLHVATECNPADICSRGMNPKKADPECMYFVGPSFLRKRIMNVTSFDASNAGDELPELDGGDVCERDGDERARCNECNVVNCEMEAEKTGDKNVKSSRLDKSDIKKPYVGVPDYTSYISKRYSDYFKCVKMTAYRYRYVVLKLRERGFKTDLVVE